MGVGLCTTESDKMRLAKEDVEDRLHLEANTPKRVNVCRRRATETHIKPSGVDQLGRHPVEAAGSS